MENFLTLPFGHITLATLTLVFTLAVLALVVELGLKLIYFVGAFDEEDAPEFTLKNPIHHLVSKVSLLRVYYKKVREYEIRKSDHKHKGFVIVDAVSGNIYDKADNKFWNSAFNESIFTTEREAQVFMDSKGKFFEDESKEIREFSFKVLWKIGIGVFLVDLLILLLQISFLPTLCITLTFLTMFCIRTLAKKFYKGMKKHGDRLDGHDKEINELKSKGE